MRITAYITVSGGRTLTRLLFPGIAELKDVSPDGTFDEIRARKALADIPGIMPSSDDCRPVYAFALQAIEYAHNVMSQLAERPGNSSQADGKRDEQCERRMKLGKCAFSRIDIKACRSVGRLRVRVSGENPHGYVGEVDNQVRETCVFWAYVALMIKRNSGEGGKVIEIVEGDGAEGCVAAAEKKMVENALWHKGEKCDRRRAGYCSPADPTCGNFDCGRCKWRADE